MISIHASAKEATWCLCRFLVVLQFQSTPPRRRRLLWAKLLNNSPSFQSTPPRRRRHEVDGYTTYSADFNPRLREGGDVLWILLWILWITISIHASAKEATMVGCIYRHFKGISIHASAKEATCRRIICIFIILFYFNPRLREGGDSVAGGRRNRRINFNPRLREGGDQNQTRLPRRISIFQSTPPRRRRPQTASCIRVTQAISIHASAKEATI